MPDPIGYGAGAYGAGMYGGMASPYADRIALEAGASYGTQLLDDAYSISFRRGVRPNGVTDDLEPAVFTAVVAGSETLNPITNDDVRPGRPIRLKGTPDAGESWGNIFTGSIIRSRLEYDPEAKEDDAAYRLIITGVCLVRELTGIPHETAVGGTLRQRVDHVLAPTGLPYVVEDPAPATVAGPLPTDAKDVLGQLRLIRDTGHAYMFVSRDGELVAVADSARPRVITAPDWIATDELATEGIHYTELDPAFDTDRVVNALTITQLDGDTNPETVWTDEDSRDDWGTNAQGITVNDGIPETHADLYLASRAVPALVPESISFVVQRRLEQALVPTPVAGNVAAAIGLELYDVVRVERTGLPTVDLLATELVHNITPAAWTMRVGLRVPEVLATRWDDVPADLTWDDVPADLTWNDAVNWHPYEGA